MVSHLVRAQPIQMHAFDHIYTHTHTHTHTHTTNTCITGDGLLENKRNNNQYAEEKMWVFSFYLVKRNAQSTGGEFQRTCLMF